jgi:hypothetical protein
VTLPAVAARGATIRAADYATTGTRPYDVVAAIASSYPMASPHIGATGSVVGTNTNADVITLSAKSGSSGIYTQPVYGLYCRIIASNQTAVNAIGLAIAWQTADGQSMANNILIDPAVAGASGNTNAEVWIFPAYQVLGRYVYTPASLNNAVSAGATPVRAAVQVSVTGGYASSNYIPSGVQVQATALTRGQREIDDIFSSFAATAQSTAQLVRSM